VIGPTRKKQSLFESKSALLTKMETTLLTPYRVDWIMLPVFVIAFFSLQLDRGNIGNAATNNFMGDVGITQLQFNIGNQLLALGIVLLEIPSNLVLYKTGPSLFLGCQVLAWSLVGTFQMFQKGPAAFFVTRFLLGCCEAGFIPGSLYTLTRFYTRNETSKRFSIFFMGNMGAGALSGLLAYGILHLDRKAGLAGWQWLFMIEGLFGVVIGVIFIALVPKSTSNPVSSFGIRFFSERDAYILTQRVLLDDPSKVRAKENISKKEIKSFFTNWKLLPHIIMTIAGIAPFYALGAYAPMLVASFGYDPLQSNALVSIGSWILLVNNLIFGWVADKYGRRGPLVLLGILILWVLMIANRMMVTSRSKETRFGLLVLMTGFAAQWHPLNSSWMSMNAPTSGERSLTMAAIIMSANTAGIVGGQLFQAHDAPLYKTGWTVGVVLISVSLIAATIANVQYRLLNRRLKPGQAAYI
jgi:MFS family permease